MRHPIAVIEDESPQVGDHGSDKRSKEPDVGQPGTRSQVRVPISDIRRPGSETRDRQSNIESQKSQIRGDALGFRGY